MSDQLRIQAGAVCIPCEVSGLVGSPRVALIGPAGQWNLSIPLVPEVNFLSPGMRAIVTLGIVAVSISENPAVLPGLNPQLLKN